MTDWTIFNETHVYPAMFDRIDEILPEFNFVDGGTVTGKEGTCRVKKSRYHVDDLQEDSAHDYVTYLYDNGQCGLWDHARKIGGSTATIYARLHNMDWQAAMAEITEKLGLSHLAPAPTGHYDDSPEAAYKRAMAEFEPFLQEERDQAQEIFVRRLWDDTATPSGKDTVLAFMKGRGWTEEHIKAAGLGMYVNAMNGDMPEGMAISLRQQSGSIGRTHILTIPYHAYGRLYSFGFRHLGGPGTEHLKRKYTNVGNVPMNHLVGIRRGVQHAIIVEGWLDHMAAKVRGVDNVFATITATATGKMLDDAIDNARVRRFTLMLDNDIAGMGGALKAIGRLRSRGIPCHIGRYPQDVKDLDEFFNVHGGTPEEFRDLVSKAESGHAFATEAIIRLAVKDIYEATNGTKYQPRDIDDATAAAFAREHATPQQRERLRGDIVRHLAATPASERLEALRCIPTWADAFALDKPSLLEASTGEEAQRQLKAEEETEREEKAAQERRDRKFANDIQKAGQAARRGEVEKAKSLAADALASNAETHKDYGQAIKIASLAELRAQARTIPDGLPTGYVFGEGTRTVRLELRTGLTFVSGATGHGKTSFLNNIVVNVAKRNYLEYQDAMNKFSDAEREGNPQGLEKPKIKSVLYFTYEESRFNILRNLMNLYCGDAMINPNDQDGAIMDYLRSDKPEDMPGSFYPQLDDPREKCERYDRFRARVRDFDALLTSGAIVVCEENYKITELVGAIKWYMNKWDTALVCIDYAQLIYPEDTSAARYEQIKSIVNDILRLAKGTAIPFLLASQFNREVASPLDLVNSKAGEGGDIERIADTHIGLYNLKELRLVKDGGRNPASAQDIQQVLSEAKGHEKIEDITSWKHGQKLKSKTGGGLMFARLMKRRGGFYPIDIILDWVGETRKVMLNDKAFAESIGEPMPSWQKDIQEATPQGPSLREPGGDARGQGLAQGQLLARDDELPQRQPQRRRGRFYDLGDEYWDNNRDADWYEMQARRRNAPQVDDDEDPL